MFRFLICPFIFLSVLPGLFAEFPLHDLAIREAILLDDWRFKAAPAGLEEEIDWSGDVFADERNHWPQVAVPGIWDQPPGKVQHPVPNQVGWYRTRIELPQGAADDEISLCFLGVKYIADLFVNGEYIGVHRGGYTPFLFPLTDLPDGTRYLEIVVRVDNRLNNHSIPKQKTDWETYGGIDREVYLLVRPVSRPEKVFVRTFRDRQGIWQLRINAESKGAPENPLSIKLLDKEKVVTAYEMKEWSNGIDLSISIDNPILWSPDQPHLYQLEFTWGDHHIRFPVGFRELEWKDGKLHLNGQPLWLQGFGQHEFFPQAGSVLNHDQRRRDLEMMKSLYHANALRTGHYPHHPDLFNLADEIGLLLFTEMPAWQNPPASLTQPEVWENWVVPQLDEMILTYRNHPSVFGWGVLNEITNAHRYIEQARARIQTMDPHRGVAAVTASEEDFAVNRLTDFAARNLHYGWYHSRCVYQLRTGLQKNIDHAIGRPIPQTCGPYRHESHAPLPGGSGHRNQCLRTPRRNF